MRVRNMQQWLKTPDILVNTKITGEQLLMPSNQYNITYQGKQGGTAPPYEKLFGNPKFHGTNYLVHWKCYGSTLGTQKVDGCISKTIL